MKRLRLLGPLAAAVFVILTLGGCTCPLKRPAAAGPAPAPSPGDRFAGSWAGTWQSAATGHHGQLKCAFTRLDARHYRADFKAYWSVLSGNYSVVFETRRVGKELHFQGEQDLGKIYGGLYHYEGRIAGDRFLTNYRAEKDHGTFELHRAATP